MTNKTIKKHGKAKNQVYISPNSLDKFIKVMYNV